MKRFDDLLDLDATYLYDPCSVCSEMVHVLCDERCPSCGFSIAQKEDWRLRPHGPSEPSY